MIEILKKYWGYDSFRSVQKDIIESIASGHDTLGLMPTGGGKSITFQVPALALEGVCIVITPLISLMKDQVDRLRRMNIVAYAVHSGMAHAEIVQAFDNCIFGKVKFLYLSPERLTTPFFLEKIKHINVSFIVVDEAHCISQWGYDFRPSYMNIAELRKHLPGKAVIALTATATPRVVEDIMHSLEFRDGRKFSMSFVRNNLTYVVRQAGDKSAEMLHILQCTSGTAIVYTMSRKKARSIADFLAENGISASYYHAGLDVAVKEKRQNDWKSGAIRVIVATNAFGMGIDKPDVRMVIHYDTPNSLEAYFQEAGRAGRDGKRSYAVLLHAHEDIRVLRTRVSSTFPGEDFVRDVYEHLAYYYEIGVGMGRGIKHVFNVRDFSHHYRYNDNQVESAMHILDRAGYIRYEADADDMTRVKFLVQHHELYDVELSGLEERIVTILLRKYTGLFSEYVFIDVTHIAHLLNTSMDNIILALKSLYNKQILRYIPPRTEPLLTYLVDRVDVSEIKLSKEVYANRREQLKLQIEAVIDYITNDSICRSRQLVRYFGEETTNDDDCGKCDVCIALRKASSASAETSLTIEQKIEQFLSDGQWHSVAEISSLDASPERILQVLDALISKAAIIIENDKVRKAE